MKRAAILALLLVGCAHRAQQAPVLMLGRCKVEAVDPRGAPSLLYCNFKDGSQSVWKPSPPGTFDLLHPPDAQTPAQK